MNSEYRNFRLKALIETWIFDSSKPSSINKNLSRERFLLHCERSHKMFLNAMETDPFKLNQRRRWQNQIFKSKAAGLNKQLPTRCISGNVIPIKRIKLLSAKLFAMKVLTHQDNSEDFPPLPNLLLGKKARSKGA